MNILITGGSSNIAFEIACHRIAMGDHIIVTASSQTSLANTLAYYQTNGLDVEGFVYNFNNQERLVEQIKQPVHGIILNAFGQQTQLSAFHDYPLGEFRANYQDNIDGNVSLLHQLLPDMVSRQFGRVIFISSASVALGTKKYAPYCLAKSALEGLMTNLAMEYSQQNILCNTVRLGLMKTSRTKQFWQKKAYEHYVSNLIPQGKMGLPSQVAEALDPLLSETSYITGSILNVSGGLPLMNPGAR